LELFEASRYDNLGLIGDSLKPSIDFLNLSRIMPPTFRRFFVMPNTNRVAAPLHY
jgi:hypothetical protein